MYGSNDSKPFASCIPLPLLGRGTKPSYTMVTANLFFLHCLYFAVTYILILLLKVFVWLRLQFLHHVKALHGWHGDDLCTNVYCCDYIFIHWCCWCHHCHHHSLTDLPSALFLPSCCLPVSCLEQICGIPLNSISPSTCSQSDRPSSTRTSSH